MDQSQFTTLSQSVFLVDKQINEKNAQLANADLEIQKLKQQQISMEEKLTLKINKLELIIDQKNEQIKQLEKTLEEHGNFELIFELEEKLEKAEKKIQQQEKELYQQQKMEMQKKSALKRAKRCSLVSTMEYNFMKEVQNNLKKQVQKNNTFQDKNFEKFDEILSLKSEEQQRKMNTVVDHDLKLDFYNGDDQESQQTLQRGDYFDLAHQLQEELKTEMEINLKNEQKIQSFQELSQNLENKVDKYEQQTKAQKKQILKLLEELDIEKHNNYILKEEKKELENKVKFLSEKVENFDLQKSQNFQNFEELSVQQQFLNSEIQRLKKEKEEQHNEDLKMIKQINASNQALEIKVLDLTKSLKELQQQNESLLNLKHTNQQTINLQKKRLQEKNDEIEQKISELEFHWKNKYENLQKEINTNDDIRINVTQENSTSSVESNDEQIVENFDENTTNQKNTQNFQIQDFFNKRNSIQSQWQSYENLIKQVQTGKGFDIKAEVDLAEQQIEKLNNKIEQQQKEIQELRKKLIQQKKSDETISAQQHKNEIKNLELKIKNLQKLCDASQTNSQISHNFGQKYLKLYEELFDKYKTEKINFSNELSQKESTIFRLTRSYQKLKKSLNQNLLNYCGTFVK